MACVREPSVIFDEAHSQAWTIRPQLASEMQPAHPGDASYAQAALLLEGHDFEVAANAAQRSTPACSMAVICW